jgi:hypothetical protein
MGSWSLRAPGCLRRSFLDLWPWDVEIKDAANEYRLEREDGLEAIGYAAPLSLAEPRALPK